MAFGDMEPSRRDRKMSSDVFARRKSSSAWSRSAARSFSNCAASREPGVDVLHFPKSGLGRPWFLAAAEGLGSAGERQGGTRHAMSKVPG